MPSRSESGQTTVEYALFVGFFAVLIIGGVIFLRGGITDTFERSGQHVGVFRPPAAHCEAAYAGGCVPPHPPTVTCADLNALGIPQVTLVGEADPHGLDPDGNGIACD